MSPIELELFDELFLKGVSDLAMEWLHKFFPSLSLMEKCNCSKDGCPGWKMKKQEDKFHEAI
ncbi:MAG: hypothetical protein A2Y81_13280 [Nitrospirae bacterium RBG_13_43_8]|nr:MAG: hypothetical protein A2Y81_13280 [Nitrospirae bacterium RBG_13_43_8]